MTKTGGWFKVLYIIMAVLYIIAGITFMMNPFESQYILGICFASVALVYGVMAIIGYFMSAHFKSVWVLIAGFCLIVLGIVIMSNLFNSMNVLGIMFGIIMLIAGAYKTFNSFRLKDFGFPSWWAVLISGICSLIIGLIVVFNFNNAGTYLALYVGVDLVVTGVSDLMVGIMYL